MINQLPNTLSAFAGQYELLQDGTTAKNINLRQDAEQLYLDIPDCDAMELQPLGSDEFAISPIHARLVFDRDEAGKVLGYRSYRIEKREPKIWKKVA